MGAVRGVGPSCRHGDVDVALVYGFGKSSPGDLARDPDPSSSIRTTSRRCGADSCRLAALQARRCSSGHGRPSATSPRSPPAAARDAHGEPARAGAAATSTPTSCSTSRTASRRCARTTARRSPTARPRSCSWRATVAREVCERPGVDPRHRPPHRAALPGVRDLTDVAVDRARGARRPASPTAASRSPSCTRTFTHEELDARRGPRPRRRRRRQPVGRRAGREPGHGAGLIRIGEAAARIATGRADRGAGPRDVGPVPAAEPRRASWRGT